VGTNSLADNQDYDVTQQLTDGIRMLQLQTHNQHGVIELCHTSCQLYDGGSLQSYLSKVKSWMDMNTNDVVSILIVNSDSFAPSAFATVFQNVGLDKIAYSPPSASLPVSGWPTLGSMIDGNTRLVVYLDSGADFTSVPWIIDEFTNIWESAFDVTNPNFDCAVNRTKGTPSTQMSLINHFLDQIVLGQPAPDPARANVTNSGSGTGSLGDQVATCVADYGVAPNFILVDFYEFGGGSVFQIAAGLNGVSYNPTSPIPSPKATGGMPSVTSVPLGAASSLSGNHWLALLSVTASIVFGALSVV